MIRNEVVFDGIHGKKCDLVTWQKAASERHGNSNAAHNRTPVFDAVEFSDVRVDDDAGPVDAGNAWFVVER